MRKVFLCVILLTGFTYHQGYSQDSTKTLFKLPKLNTIGFYIAPEFQYGQLKNNFTDFGGLSGMILFNKSFGIGFSMYKSLDRGYAPSGVSPLVLHASYAGLKFEYTLNPDNAIHISFPLTIGGGNASLDSASYVSRIPVRDSVGRRLPTLKPRVPQNNFFLIQPGVQLEANLFKAVKLYAGVNYRFVLADKLTTLPMNTMQGFSADIGVKIGLFGIPLHKTMQ
jgi:hypothetical protein